MTRTRMEIHQGRFKVERAGGKKRSEKWASGMHLVSHPTELDDWVGSL